MTIHSNRRRARRDTAEPIPQVAAILITERGRSAAAVRAHCGRYGRQVDLLLDFIHGDRTRRSGRGLHSRLASGIADDRVALLTQPWHGHINPAGLRFAELVPLGLLVLHQ